MTGLRELKKARTRASIREHALRLFREQGYAATTVEQIAAAAEVSSSTFFRYFPTKEDVVLQDDFDVRMFEAFERQPADLPVLAAIRAALREGVATLTPDEWAQLREATELATTVPEVQARLHNEMARTVAKMTEVLARRYRLPSSDLRVRTVAGVLLGVMSSFSMSPEGTFETGADMFDQVDAALGLLEQGVPFSGRS
jgi:AcrR family transcriptional regulator